MEGGRDMKTFHVTNISKGRRHVSYVIRIEDGETVECSIPFCFYFNKDVEIYNSTILYMFETIRTAPRNRKLVDMYKWVVDLEPDVDVVALRKGYQNLLLADGTGLDSHAIRMLGDASGKLKYVTIADLKGIELENINREEFDTDDSVVMVGDNYLWNQSVGDVRLDFTHDGNRLYSLMLLIDHFKARKVLTADCGKVEDRTYLGATTNLYTCNFLYGDIGTSYVNARLDPSTYYDRLVNCGFYPPYKNLRKYLVAKYLQTKYGVQIFSAETERAFFAVNNINITGTPGIAQFVKDYKQRKLLPGGSQLFDSFILSLNTIDLAALRKELVHTSEQEREFDELVSFAQEEYARNRDSYDGIRLFDEAQLRETFGDDGEFLKAILSGMKHVTGMSCAPRQLLVESKASTQNWVPIEKIAAMARKADGLADIVLEMTVEASAPFSLSVYYTNGNDHDFLACRHVDVAVKQGRNKLAAGIPVGFLAKLRIDFGVAPGLVRVSPVTMRGAKSVVLDWRKFAFHDVEARMISDDGSITLFSKGKDPYAVYSTPLNLQSPVAE